MACGCRATPSEKFLWIPSGESSESDKCVPYSTEIQAKAKVMRKGGTYIPMVKNPSGNFIVRQ